MKLIKQSGTAQPLLFLLLSSTDHITPLTGLGSAVTVTISKNGAAFATPSGAITEVGNGWYQIAGNATDTNTLGQLILHAIGTGSDPADERYEIVAFDPLSATDLGLSAFTTLSTAISGVAAAVWAVATRTLSAFGFTVNTNANATETAIKTKTDNLPNDPTSEAVATTNKNAIITAIPSAATVAAAVWAVATRTLSAFGFTVDTNANATETAIKTKTDALPSDPTSESAATTNKTTILSAIPSAATVAAAVWAVATRTLSAFGFTVNTNANATETAIKAKTDNLPADPTSEAAATTNKNTIITAIGGGGGGSSHPIDPIGK